MISGNTHLRIIHTNDIHSHFEQIPNIAAAIKALKAPFQQDHVLILDIGDHMDRMSSVTEGSAGLANIDVMNQIGYELVVLGNNEGLTFTSDQLCELYSEHAQFDVLGANMFDKETGALPDWIAPYRIVHKAGVKIGVIGVTIDFILFYELLGWELRDPVQIVERWVTHLRNQVDLIVVMSHLGINRDREMANQIKGIDLILGGHTHHLLETPERIKDTIVCAAGRFGTHVGYVDIQFHIEKQELTIMQGGCEPTSRHPQDIEMKALVHRHQQRSKQALSDPVTSITDKLSIQLHQESSLGNLLAAGIRKWTQSDLAIINSGQILQSLLPGEITREMILEMCPSPINPCRMRLNGAQILQALEETLLVENREQIIRGFGFRGTVLGMLCLDGIKVYYDPHGKPLQKIVRTILDNGESIALEQEYCVGTLDMFTFGIGYLSLKEGTDIKYYLPEFIRDVLTMQLLNKEEIQRSKEFRWHKAYEV